MSRTKKKSNNNGNNNHLVSFGLELANIQPLTENQKIVFENFEQNYHQALIGVAGTGKSFISLYLAFKYAMEQWNYYIPVKILIIKSAVPTRDIGFLPGTLDDKIKYYEDVYKVLINKLFHRDDAFSILSDKGVLEFATTSFLRGTTFENCVVITDEIQNMTFHELDTIITRVGKGCKLFFVGDEEQCDLDQKKSGFTKFINILEKMKSFAIVRFQLEDIVRDDIVKEYLIAKYFNTSNKCT
jgi:phosphate starvation-inducible protein PhoH